MGIKIRIRNGMQRNTLTGEGGATEGDLRGSTGDIIENASSVPYVEDGHLLVHESTPPALSVVLDPGVVYIPNADFDPFDSDSIKFWEAVVDDSQTNTLTLSSNSSGQPRVDIICVNLDITEYVNNDGSNISEYVVIEGTPGAGAPAVPDNHTKVAEVTVQDGATAIYNADITDTRDQTKIRNDVLPDRLTGVRVDKRVRTLTTTSTVTADVDDEDIIEITSLGVNLTIAAPTGTPTNSQTLLYRIQDNGISRTLTWNAVFREVGTYLPTDTEAGKVLYVGAVWNAASSKWDVVLTAQE